MSKIVRFLHHVVFMGFFEGRKEVTIIKANNDTEITLLIPDVILKDKTFSNYSLAVYCVLQALVTPTHLYKQCITLAQIEFYLTGQVSNRRRISDYIRCGINELIENKIILKESECQKNYILDCKKMWVNTKSGNFTTITFSEVQKIFQLTNINNFLLLHYFILLMSTITSSITVYLPNGDYKNRVVGNFTIDYLSKLAGISERSIIEYNKILEENNLLYVNRNGDFVLDEQNNIKKMSNVYGRPCDSEYINEFANSKQKYNSSYRYVQTNEVSANNNRRLAQMYQQILKGNGERYSKTEIIEIYDYIVSQNKKYDKLYEKHNYEEYLNKIRDVSVFEKYDFLQKRKNE